MEAAGRPGSSTTSCSFTGDIVKTRVLPSETFFRKSRVFARAEEGAALVEFAMVLPMMLLVFAVIIEGSRMMYAYQSAIGGVRDATRYLARVVPGNVCAAGGSVTGHAPKLMSIVSQSTTGGAIYPGGVTVTSVTPSLACVGRSGTCRVSPAPVATVTAVVDIAFPFQGIFGLFGGTPAGITTTVIDRAKVFGT